jgi:NADH-quinone oxidoreductase subunit L
VPALSSLSASSRRCSARSSPACSAAASATSSSQAITTGGLLFWPAPCLDVFSQWTWGGLEAFTVKIAPFITVGDFKSVWSIRIDALSATVMLIVVTTVSSLVHLYSWGYMAEDDSKPRFFAYLSLFTFAMLALVTAADFMQLFFGWEGVGLASYLLIGFWFKKPTASAAAIKAFVVNRVGDFGFALGHHDRLLDVRHHPVRRAVPDDRRKARHAAGSSLGHSFRDRPGRLPAVHRRHGQVGPVLPAHLAAGRHGRPDPGVGPDPRGDHGHRRRLYGVPAVADVRIRARHAKNIVTVIGAITALFAATVGLTQNDIKRVIAYSTCSQLGYMFFAAGVGAYQAAMFHLFTHAFFKALLFLGAGSVIHGMHHEQDMRKMGGLWKLLPVTYAMMLIGTIAITGLGIPAVGGFAGFYSKDSIIEAAFAAGQRPIRRPACSPSSSACWWPA